MAKLWQRNYYEYVIRNGESYNTIAGYIINNPAKWNEDKFLVFQAGIIGRSGTLSLRSAPYVRLKENWHSLVPCIF
jgi:hypothetical protein